MKKILVTGGSGKAGKATINKLLEKILGNVFVHSTSHIKRNLDYICPKAIYYVQINTESYF